MKSTVFWDITPCSPLSVNRRFGGHIASIFRVEKISSAGNQRQSRWQEELKMEAMWSSKTRWLSTDYTALYPRRWYSSILLSVYFISETTGRISIKWRWRQCVPLKRRLTLNRLHGIISQKIVLFTTTTVRTSNSTYWHIFSVSWSTAALCEVEDVELRTV
jgi:hypothetical protein